MRMKKFKIWSNESLPESCSAIQDQGVSIILSSQELLSLGKDTAWFNLSNSLQWFISWQHRNQWNKHIFMPDFHGSGEKSIHRNERPDGLVKAWGTEVSFRGAIWGLFLCLRKKNQWEPSTQYSQLGRQSLEACWFCQPFTATEKCWTAEGKSYPLFSSSFLYFQKQVDTFW